MLAPLSAPDGAAYETPLSCDRVYFAGARGVCLAVEGELLKRNVAYVFDDTFTKLHKVRLTGLPSRTRLSPDGRLAAITVFEHGHSYAEDGFSTRTTIVDTAKGSVLTDLEQFTIVRDGVRFKAVDFNFWGVTFTQRQQPLLRHPRQRRNEVPRRSPRRFAGRHRAPNRRRMSVVVAGQ